MTGFFGRIGKIVLILSGLCLVQNIEGDGFVAGSGSGENSGMVKGMGIWGWMSGERGDHGRHGGHGRGWGVEAGCHGQGNEPQADVEPDFDVASGGHAGEPLISGTEDFRVAPLGEFALTLRNSVPSVVQWFPVIEVELNFGYRIGWFIRGFILPFGIRAFQPGFRSCEAIQWILTTDCPDFTDWGNHQTVLKVKRTIFSRSVKSVIRGSVFVFGFKGFPLREHAEARTHAAGERAEVVGGIRPPAGWPGEKRQQAAAVQGGGRVP